ncbi:MAG: hypothetical protein IJ649_10780 [Oscillospiraceae bacterium]|nr:hypothetical protein [Oscillospiraceae bacterium]
MTKGETPTVTKLKNRRGLWWGILLSAAALFLVLPKELLMETLGRIQSRGLLRTIDTMWRFNRGPLYGLCIFAFLALLCVIALLRIFALSRRIAHEPDNVPVNAPARPGTPQTAKGSAAMSRKPMDKKSLLIMIAIIAVIMIYAVAEDPDAIIPAVGTMVIVTSIVVAVIASNKTKAGKTGKTKTEVELHRPFPQPTAVKTKQPPRAFRHADEVEEAITCAHHTGREKYLEQVEGFYKNGLIDRAEYKALREKYEKMDIPEDYH